MSLLTILGAPADAVLPNAQTESFKYTSLRALNSKAAQFIPAGLALDVSSVLMAAPQIPFANKASQLRSNGFFGALAAKQACFEQTLDGTHYFQVVPEIDKALVQQCHAFKISDDTKAVMIWHHSGSAEGSLCNLFTHVEVGARAKLKLIRIQNANTSASILERTEIQLASESQVEVIDLTLGAQLSRHELHIDFNAPLASATVIAASCLNGRQHHDLQLSLQHNALQTTSHTRIKTIAMDRARGVIGGRIFVAKGADQTDAQLKTQNLLLSSDAEIDAKPELEIHADEVVCAHGATVGQLDEQALFYLRSRGLDQASARNLLTFAFAAEVLSHIDDMALREQLHALLLEKLS
jgi:FeS assembly protein SufD